MKGKFTPGPWEWNVNLQTKHVYLRGAKWMTVMDFVRWGMGGAVPRFISEGLMYKATDFAVPNPGDEHNAAWRQTISHPDAQLILAAPALFQFALAVYLDPETTDSMREDAARVLRHAGAVDD